MNRFTDQIVMTPALATNANASTGPVDVRKYSSFSIQGVFDQSGGADGAGDVALEGSNDTTNPPTNFIELRGTSTAYTNSTLTVGWDPVVTSLRWIRVTTSGTSGTTAGTATFNFNGVWGS